MADEFLSGARIVGATQSTYRKEPTADAITLLTETTLAACSDVGIEPERLDGLAVSSFQLPPDNVITVAEQLGCSIKWAWQSAHGGAGGVVSVIQAAEAISLGRADVIVCVAADSFTVASHNSMLAHFNQAMQRHLAPYAFGGANGLFALVEREHRHRYGTSREQLARIAVAQRSHAQMNPNAIFRAPLSVEDYLAARIIADPIRLYDCVLPCEGADAVVLVSSAVARDLGLPGVRVVAASQRHNHLPNEVLSTTTGAAAFAEQLFTQSGITRRDIDFAQIYDDYPIMVAIQLEDLGFARKGEIGAFLEETDLSIHGEFPLNTGGGQLSCGQAGASGGMIGVFEAATQLLGQAGSRQISAARIGLVAGFGMVGYGKGLCSAALVLRAEQ